MSQQQLTLPTKQFSTLLTYMYSNMIIHWEMPFIETAKYDGQEHLCYFNFMLHYGIETNMY